MKINKSNPRHWAYLAIFTMNVCLVLLLRSFWLCKSNTVILYGHKLNGNLKAIQDYALGVPDGPELIFLTMDPGYYQALKSQGKSVLFGLHPLHMLKLVTAYALISDHGLHSLILLLKFSDMKFVDVWHGIPFKGFDEDDFRVQHQYDEVWVASEKLKQLYSERFGFSEAVLKVTGYARTDMLIHDGVDRREIRARLGVPTEYSKVVLFAPTWQQDDKSRSIFPFGIDESDFLHRMNEFCQAQDAICIVRKHLNVKSGSQSDCAQILYRSYEDYPDAEEVLLASDILVCDWSSIAFDYLLLDRPTIFLDVPPPFRKGFSLDANHRFGHIVHGLEGMFEALGMYLQSSIQYLAQNSHLHKRVRDELYGDMVDGKASARCYARLLALAPKSNSESKK